MNDRQRNTIFRIAVGITMLVVMAVLVGCDGSEQTTGSGQSQVSVNHSAGDQRPLSDVVESNGFTLRASVSPTDVLPDAMARQYGITPEADLFLLNLVISNDQPDQQSSPVSAEVSAHYESLIGHVETIDMREVEADGHISYIGTLDASDQRAFQLVIEARPSGVNQPLQMNFEVQLRAQNTGDVD